MSCVREYQVAAHASPTAGEPDFFSRQTTQARRFWLDLEPAASASLVVVCGGKEHCGSDYAIHRPGFRFYSVEFVAQGKGTLTFGRQTYALVPGTVFAYGPGVPHDVVSDPADTMVKFFVDFAGRDARGLLRRCGLPPGGVVQTRAHGELVALFEDLIQNGFHKTPFTPEVTALVTRHLLVKIAETGVTPGGPDLPSFATYRRCRQYLEEHWCEIARLDDVARPCGVESAYLCRLFKRFDHQTPHRYLVSLRMREAAQWLGRPQTTVKDVAEALGFADQFHFSRVFKSFYGVPPGLFARRLNAADRTRPVGSG
jgi:AraC-like DNA-binding protein/quercetin dioxygenase-like cupin family protein